MPVTELSEIQARLASLKKARDTGALIVRHGDTLTQFRTLAEMNAIIAELEGDILGLTTTTPRRKVRYLYQSGKGL